MHSPSGCNSVVRAVHLYPLRTNGDEMSFGPEEELSIDAKGLRKKNQEKDAQAEKIKRKIVFSDLRNPPKRFTPLFGEVAKFRTLTKTEEQESRDGEEAEHCLPQAT